jgi:hypothetical protein
MATIIDNSRAEMLSEVQAKRATALRYARLGDSREQEQWLRVAGRMTAWIEQLEAKGATRRTPTIWPSRGIVLSRYRPAPAPTPVTFDAL